MKQRPKVDEGMSVVHIWGKNRQAERTKDTEAWEKSRSGISCTGRTVVGCSSSRGKELRGERPEKCKNPEHMGLVIHLKD